MATKKHKRHLIREAAAAALRLKTAAEERVATSRRWPWKAADLPAIAVYTLGETVDPESHDTAPRELRRRVLLSIEAVIVATEDVDDELDAIALQIERAMHADDTLGGASADTVLTSTEMSLADEGRTEVGIVKLVYTATYHTMAPDAEDQDLDDLNTVDVVTSLENAQPAGDRAHDVIDDLQD